MLRTLCLLTVLVLLVGCAGKTTPDEWRQYARGAYLQGVADGKASVKCQPVVRGQTIGIAPEHAPVCDQARVDKASLDEVSKQADYDLTNSKKERQRSLMRYIELGGKAAQ